MISAVTVLLLAAARLSHAQDDETRKHLLHELGGPFFVSRDPVQEDLKLSDEQKQKLREKLSPYVQETKTVQNLKAGERKQAMGSLRQKSSEELETFLKETLTAKQFKRFQQLKLQYEMPPVMLQPEVGKELNITDEQRKQFMGLIQEMQKEMVPLMKEAKSGRDPAEGNQAAP
jgi:Spy/CpxP family protein refolding chaperone